MEDKRLCKIIDTINGVIYETEDKNLNNLLKDIIEDLTIDVHYCEDIRETMTYYKRLTTIRNDLTIEEDTNYQTIIKIYGEDFPQLKNPYSIY